MPHDRAGRRRRIGGARQNVRGRAVAFRPAPSASPRTRDPCPLPNGLSESPRMVAQTTHSASGASSTDDRVHPFTRMHAATGRDDFYSDALNRERGDEAPPEWLIDGLLPRGVTVLVAD